MLMPGDAFVVVMNPKDKTYPKQYVATAVHVRSGPADEQGPLSVYAVKDAVPRGVKLPAFERSQQRGRPPTPPVPIHVQFLEAFDKSAEKPYAFKLPHIVYLKKKKAVCERALWHNNKMWIASSGGLMLAKGEGTIWRYAEQHEKERMKPQRTEQKRQLYIFNFPTSETSDQDVVDDEICTPTSYDDEEYDRLAREVQHDSGSYTN